MIEPLGRYWGACHLGGAPASGGARGPELGPNAAHILPLFSGLQLFPLGLLSYGRIFVRQRGRWELLSALCSSEGCWALHSPFGRLRAPLLPLVSGSGLQHKIGAGRSVVSHSFPHRPSLTWSPWYLLLRCLGVEVRCEEDHRAQVVAPVPP